MTAFAGTGEVGDTDNIDATLARLNSPRGLAIDPSGDNLYIADLFNHRVRKVNLTAPTAIITTAVGMTGVACLPNTDPCGDEQPVEFAKITSPTNVSFDSHGNLYVNSQTRVRKVDTSGIITTVAGTGVQGFSGDGGPALAATLSALRGGGFDAADNYYIGGPTAVTTGYDGSTWRLRSSSSPTRPAGSRHRSSFPPVGTHLSSTRIR